MHSIPQHRPSGGDAVRRLSANRQTVLKLGRIACISREARWTRPRCGTSPAAFLKLARYTFRLDLATGRLETAGGAPSAAERVWLRDTLPAHARTVYQPEEHLAVIVARVAGEPHAVMYTGMERAGALRTLVAVDVDPKGFEPSYTMCARTQPSLLRPPSAAA